MSRAVISRRVIAARLDALALDQLREEAARLAVENERLHQLLDSAERSAEFWRDEATSIAGQVMDQDGRVGITRDGHLVADPGAAS